MMTLQEALAIADAANVRRKPAVVRNAMDKLAGTTTGQLTAGINTLNKRHSGMSSAITDLQKELDRARAGVALFADAMKINLMETLQ
jgi:hypothetical protein